MRRFATLVVVTACSAGSTRDAANTTRESVTPKSEISNPAVAIPLELGKPDPVAKGVPHGGSIVLVATTEQADAAITQDEISGLRLWPTLDGARPPVPVAEASLADQLALAHDGRDLVAVARDSAGTVHVTRLGLDGSVRGRHQLPGGPVYAQVVVTDRTILARTRDHVIEIYALDGTPRGRLVADPGQRVIELAARDGRAVAIVQTGDDHQLRWLTLGARASGTDVDQAPSWDAPIELPVVPRAGLVALAPGLRRIALVDTGNTGVQVYDVGATAVPVSGSRTFVSDELESIGFLDDNTVGFGGRSGIAWWQHDSSGDPWANTQVTPPSPSLTSTLAFGDHRVVAAYSASLALVDSSSTHYLGWSELGTGAFVPVEGDEVALVFSAFRFAWLDNKLEIHRGLDLQSKRDPKEPPSYGTPMTGRHVLAQTYENDHSRVSIVDVETPDKPLAVGTFATLERVEYAHGYINVVADHQLRRFAWDAAAGTVSEQEPAISLGRMSVSWARSFDPARADGIAAVVIGWDTDYAESQSMLVYRQDGAKLKKQRFKNFAGQVLSAEADGTLYIDSFANQEGIAIVHGTDVRERIPRPQGQLAIAPGAGAIASMADQEIRVVDLHGTERWRTSLWRASAMAFVGNRLLVNAPSGIVAFDRDTGRQVGMECGWNFGLHDTQPDAMTVGMAPVCEDPIVQ